MGKAIVSLIKLLFAILLVPICYGLTLSFSKELVALGDLQKVFIWGGLTYIFLQLFFYSPQGVFQFGQKIFGDVFKSVPFLAAIIPLFLPIIPTVLLLIAFILVSFFDYSPAQPYLIFFIGFSWAMHLILSAHAEFEEDDNALKPHYLFLLSLTYIINLMIIAALLSLSFSSFSIPSFFADAYQTARDIYVRIFEQLFMVR